MIKYKDIIQEQVHDLYYVMRNSSDCFKIYSEKTETYLCVNGSHREMYTVPVSKGYDRYWIHNKIT